MKRIVNTDKFHLNKKWVADHTFAEFQKIKSFAKLPYKEQVKIWKDAGGELEKKPKKEGK
ncbi:hypothetical protein RPMD05_80 [Rhodobacteraceae phage LS06-2018-MD05]|nr:hypothetical protein RPMD05_80 [Rhodobacteraceae phage LS06-2018-MD05]